MDSASLGRRETSRRRVEQGDDRGGCDHAAQLRLEARMEVDLRLLAIGKIRTGYPSWMSSTTAISVPITPVAAAARGPATNFATAAQAVTITAAARRTTTGEATWDGESRLTMMPTATIATMSTRETNQSLLSPGCADLVRQGRWVNRGLAGSSGVHGGPADDDVEPFRPDDP